MADTDTVESLKKKLKSKDAEIEELKKILSKKQDLPQHISNITFNDLAELNPRTKLTNEEIGRYSRQLILPEIGVSGQLSLSSKSALIVGAGGLGCPAAVYLAAAGIGRIGIIDYDEVELTNLHRQILHSELKVGAAKSASAAAACQQLNSHVQYVPYHLQLDSSNAMQIIQQYDVVLDASDNVATRYLLNDACVLANKPLVSGSALRFEGQLTVYHYKDGPCYRCLYPKPPPPETVTNCSDGGVLGVIPGIIGSMQALEAIKLAAGIGPAFSQKMLMFDGLEGTFRTIKLRGRQPKCEVCGDHPTITQLIDYLQFCGARADDKEKSLTILSPEDRISVQEYKQILDSGQKHLLVDVRTVVELDICKLPAESYNLPISDVDKTSKISSLSEKLEMISEHSEHFPVYVVCRRGNDSQIATRKLRDHIKLNNIEIKDIRGGLSAWAKQIDNNFPVY